MFINKHYTTSNTVADDQRDGILRRTVWFTEKEQKVLEALVEKGSYRKASEHLKTQGIDISEGSIRQMTLRIRNRYYNANGFVQRCTELQNRLTRNFGRRHKFIVE